jgi:tripartite-type tricarboxylate transporter receptor subunit TctC
LNNEINMLMDNPEIANNLKNEGALAIRTTPEAFGAHIQSEITVWREVIRRAAIKAS